MISASEPKVFVPCGREQLKHHPGPVIEPTTKPQLQPESHLLHLLSQVNLSDTTENEWWRLRECPDLPQCEEELYVRGKTTVWSRGEGSDSASPDVDGNRHVVICCYTSETPVTHALWTTFHTCVNDRSTSDQPSGKPMPSVCIVDETNIKVFTAEGEDFIASLQFQVENVWSMRHGLLLSRAPTHGEDSRLPTLFALLHPLDEITPVVVKQGGVSFMSDSSQKIIFSCEDPPMLLMYDSRTGLHSAWKVRKAFPEECQAVCGTESSLNLSTSMYLSSGNVSSASNTALHRSLFGNVSLNTGLSSPTQAPTRTHSPMAAISRCQSPGTPTWLNRSSRLLQSPITPSSFSSPVSTASPSALSRLLTDNCAQESRPVYPQICLELVWTENAISLQEGAKLGCAKHAFLTSDVVGQTYLCYLVPSRRQLLYARLEKTNATNKLIFGITASVAAIDAAPLSLLNMILVLEPNGGLVLYSGTVQVGKIHLPGMPALTNSSFLSVNQATQFGSPFPRRSSLLPTYRAAGSQEPAFDERVQLLSPVPHHRSSLLPMYKNLGNLLEPTFDERLEMISPVPQDKSSSTLNDTTQIVSNKDGIQALRDHVRNRVTLEYGNGSLFRISLPDTCSSPLVSLCLNTLKQVLPRDLAIQLVVRWYGARNAPGTQDIAPNQEWRLFIGVLLGMLGYEVDKLTVMQQHVTETSESPCAQPKKKRSSSCGSEEDWEYLLNSTHHQSLGPGLSSLLGLTAVNGSISSCDADMSHGRINSHAILFSCIPLVLFSLHLLYEDMKLNSLLLDSQSLLAQLLHQLASDLRYGQYSHHYWLDFPIHCPIVPIKESQVLDPDLLKLTTPNYLPAEPPNIFNHIFYLIEDLIPLRPFPHISNVNKKSKNIIQLIGLLTVGLKDPNISLEKFVRTVVPAGSRTDSQETPAFKSSLFQSAAHKAVFLMTEMGMKLRDIATFPAAIALFLSEALYATRESPPADWPQAAYELIIREDLAAQYETPESSRLPIKFGEKRDFSYLSSCLSATTRVTTDVEQLDGMEGLDVDIMKMRWPKDQRVAEARRLLQSSQPVSITIQQRPEVSDHEFIEEQEKHLYALCTRTMALPVGRGMFTLRTSNPVVTEPLPVPRLCLTGRVPPRGTTVDLSHIEVVPNMNLWPLFHNGVAAGLKIASSASDINSNWIVYNKPKGGTEGTEHAGFLMALGLNGHLNGLAVMNTYDYLAKCHEMTSVGLLLGIAASKRGTMDVNATKLLSIHVEALLPPTSIELDIPQNVQVAALLGIGLVYQSTGHRHIAEVLLNEIGRPPGPEMENSVDRESYSLAAGLALGHVVLGQGSQLAGLADLAIPDMLHYYMAGGRRRQITGSQKEKYKSPSYQIQEGDSVNSDVTSPGATLALGMMYFNTGNRAVADWMKAPDTQYLLDFVRPDFLLLRMIARNLILWDDVLPTSAWVEGHVPDSIRPYCFVKPEPNASALIDYETMNQAYCNILAGACFSLGLRFAGSSNKEAFCTLLFYAKKFTSLLGKSIAELAGKSTIETCLNVILLSLAMVMTGSGELEAMRICRFLRARVGPTNSVVTYGSHLATHMALGLLFLGGGRYTLSTSPPALAAMLAAFFPKFPTHSNDNRYHLQAFRHLYVLAVEPRLLVPKDFDSSSICYAHLTVVYLDTKHYAGQTAQLWAPCLLPELSLLKEVRIEDDRYWTMTFQRGHNWDKLRRILEGTGQVEVKQRAGCLSYSEDPQGFRSLLARTLTAQKATAWSVQPESIYAFISDPSTLNFARLFLNKNNSELSNFSSGKYESHLMQTLTALVYESVTQDKLSVLPIWITVLKSLRNLRRSPCVMLAWQLKLLVAQVLRPDRISDKPLIAADQALSISQSVNLILDSWEEDLSPLIRQYFECGKAHGSSENMRKLATYLTYHGIPPPQYLNEVLISANPFTMKKELEKLHLPPSTVAGIANVTRTVFHDVSL